MVQHVRRRLLKIYTSLPVHAWAKATGPFQFSRALKRHSTAGGEEGQSNVREGHSHEVLCTSPQIIRIYRKASRWSMSSQILLAVGTTQGMIYIQMIILHLLANAKILGSYSVGVRCSFVKVKALSHSISVLVRNACRGPTRTPLHWRKALGINPFYRSRVKQ